MLYPESAIPSEGVEYLKCEYSVAEFLIFSVRNWKSILLKEDS
jgi:hypothetical protein